MSKLYDFFDYHQKTKHSYYSVRNSPNRLDWDNQPNTFKNYPKNYKRVDLNTSNINHSFLYLIAGISAKKTYPNIEYYLRTNPSAGALYPNEIYFQVRNVDGFIFFISSVYYMSSCKYKNLDAGHVIGCVEASSYLFDKNFSVIYDLHRNELNKLFNFNNEEFFTSIILCCNKSNGLKKEISLEIPHIDASSISKEYKLFEENNLIEDAYKKSSVINNKKVELLKANFIYNRSLFKDVIFKRRSIREFSNKSISKIQFESILNILNQPLTSDCDEVVDIYYVVNRVEGLKIGLYKNNECIKEGDFKSKVGYLCPEQDLGKSSAVTFFLASKSSNYQALYQKAGIIGHRLYLSSSYLDIQCSGIGAYYDDEVCEFIDDYSMILYALAIGN